MGKAEIEAYLMWLEINESDPLIDPSEFMTTPGNFVAHLILPRLVEKSNAPANRRAATMLARDEACSGPSG